MGSRPYVVAHLAVSVEGAMTGFEPDLARFYALATTWQEDVTLVGADTILAQEPVLRSAPRPGPAAAGPLLAVVDGRGRVREWEALRQLGYWSDVVALYAESTPPRPPDRTVAELIVGFDRIELEEALQALAGREGVEVIRVDSGGTLVGVLLEQGLVDEVSLLVHPVLVGAQAKFWYGASVAATELDLVSTEQYEGGLLWLRYRKKVASPPGGDSRVRA
jgi:2,5-diamino-6-(ribosylamino)-4(3H)-pyrimidinone 5'-phosphate reductase